MGDASNPAPDNKYHLEYKTFIKNLVLNKNIEIIYSTPDNSDDIFTLISKKIVEFLKKLMIFSLNMISELFEKVK